MIMVIVQWLIKNYMTYQNMEYYTPNTLDLCLLFEVQIESLGESMLEQQTAVGITKSLRFFYLLPFILYGAFFAVFRDLRRKKFF